MTVWYRIIAVLFITLFYSCSTVSVSSYEGGGGSEIALVHIEDNQIYGTVAPGSEICLFPYETVPDSATQPYKRVFAGDDSLFTITEKIDGIYTIILSSPSGEQKVLIDSINSSSDTTITASMGIGQIMGKVLLDSMAIVLDSYEEVKVYIRGTDIFTTTDQQGNFIINNIPVGTMVLASKFNLDQTSGANYPQSVIDAKTSELLQVGGGSLNSTSDGVLITPLVLYIK